MKSARVTFGMAVLMAAALVGPGRAADGRAPLDARACGEPGSRCEVLAQGIANPRSLSHVLPDGTFFVGSAGIPASDLFNEAVTGQDADSVLSGDLENWLGRRLPATLVWESPTIEALARHLGGPLAADDGPALERDPLQDLIREIEDLPESAVEVALGILHGGSPAGGVLVSDPDRVYARRAEGKSC